MKRTGDPKADRIEVTISGQHHDIPVRVSDVDGLTSYYIPFDLGALGRNDIVLDLFHPDDEPTEQHHRRTPLHPSPAELRASRHAIAGLVGLVAMGREQPSPEVLDAIATEALRSSGWEPPGWGSRTEPPPIPITITHDPEPLGFLRWLLRWANKR